MSTNDVLLKNFQLEPTEQDYFNFQKILNHFVHLLSAGRKGNPDYGDFIDNEVKVGLRGTNQKLLDDCDDYLHFSNGIQLGIVVGESFYLVTSSSFIAWASCNITASWNASRTQDRTSVIGLHTHFNQKDPLHTKFRDGPVHTLKELGLRATGKSIKDTNEDDTPSEDLKAFYKEFEDLCSAYINESRNK